MEMEYSDCQIRVEGLHKRFNRLEVLKGVDLTIKRGEVIVVMDPEAYSCSLKQPGNVIMTLSSSWLLKLSS